MAETSGPRLSLCIIVKNEAFFIEDCLGQAAPYVDEIILVDTGSTDQTVTLAKAYTDRIYHFEWCDDFAAARNFSLEQASGDWIVVLDADEVIEPGHWKELRDAMAAAEKEVYFLERRNYSNEASLDAWVPVVEPDSFSREYPGYRAYPIARLFVNRADIRFKGSVHETLDTSGEAVSTGTLSALIHHYEDEDGSKPRRERQLNYMRIIETSIEAGQELPPGLYMAAGSARLNYLEDYSGAIAHFSKALELDENRTEARKCLALSLYLAGDHEEAFTSYQALYDEGYKDTTVCMNLANLSVKKGQFSLARTLLQEVVAKPELPATTREQLQSNIRYLAAQVDKT
jgi:glycosyltransferase involved in cell wall biosynthesis